eukprot:m.66757 g.66757  ORF g.66757 m.66757 type:complete len:756 (+) comp13778_c2_seq1:716-2983(+)
MSDSRGNKKSSGPPSPEQTLSQPTADVTQPAQGQGHPHQQQQALAEHAAAGSRAQAHKVSPSVTVTTGAIISVTPSKVSCGLIPQQDMHTLKTVEVTHVWAEQRPVRVSLSSTLGSRIGFQVENENLDRDGNVCDQVNELFNRVNRVQEFVLAPGTTQRVVVAFLPELADLESSDETPDTNASTTHAEPAHPDTPDDFGHTHATTHISGKLFFAVHVDDQAESPAEELSVKFRSKVCKSVMYVDPLDLDLNFEDCVAGEQVCRDVTVHNRSEIPLHFAVSLSSSGMTNEFEFALFDSGRAVTTATVEPFSNKQLRVNFIGRALGEETQTAQLINLHNATNCFAVQLHGNVVEKKVYQQLRVEPTHLDFGQLYLGQAMSRPLVLQNKAARDAEVVFSCPLPNVTFHLPLQNTSSASARESQHGASPAARRRRGQTASGTSASPLRAENQCESVVLGPGGQQTVYVQFLPTKDLMSKDASASGTLSQRLFNVTINSGRGRRLENTLMVRCSSRLCESRVRLATSVLDCGEVVIGTKNKASFKLTNVSEMAAKIELHIVSKTVRCRDQSVVVPPLRSSLVYLDLCPHRVNPNFQKTLQLLNVRNPDNELHLTIKAKCIAATTTSLLDTLMLTTPDNQPALTFPSTVLNSSCLRVFNLKNNARTDIELDVISSRKDVELFVARTCLTGFEGDMLRVTRGGSEHQQHQPKTSSKPQQEQEQQRRQNNQQQQQHQQQQQSPPMVFTSSMTKRAAVIRSFHQ